MASTIDKPQAAAPAPPQETAPPPQKEQLEPLLVQCASCGSPIAFDQTYCVECGAKNERPGGRLSRFRTRRYLLGGLGVLLVIGGIVGYAVAAASRHDAVKIASKSVGPPSPPVAAAPAPPAQAAPTPPPAPAKPPSAAPASPPSHPAPPASHPSNPAPSATSTTPTSHGNSSSGGGSNQAQPSPAPSHTTSAPAYEKLFGSGRSPVSAGPFDPNGQGGLNANSLSKVFDDDAGTVWKSGTYANGVNGGVGFYVDDGAPGTIKGLGLLAKTPGFDVQVYGYNGDTPPQALSDWTLLGSKANAGERNNIKLDLAGKQYQLYLVWFTKLPAKGRSFEIPEVQLLP
jgi:hypothetical protein